MGSELTKEQEAALAAYARAVQAQVGDYGTHESDEKFDAMVRARMHLRAVQGYGRPSMHFSGFLYANALLDRLAAAERDTAFLLEIVGDHVDPKHLTSEDAETLNRIRQRTQEKP